MPEGQLAVFQGANEVPALELAWKRLFKGLLARNELVVAAFA